MLAGLESLESGKDSPGNNRSGENGGRVGEPTLVSPTKPVLVSPARSFSGADARGAVENENTAADESVLREKRLLPGKSQRKLGKVRFRALRALRVLRNLRRERCPRPKTWMKS